MVTINKSFLKGKQLVDNSRVIVERLEKLAQLVKDDEVLDRILNVNTVIRNGYNFGNSKKIVTYLMEGDNLEKFNEQFILLVTTVAYCPFNLAVLGVKLAYCNFAELLLKNGLLSPEVALALVGENYPIGDKTQQYVNSIFAEFVS